MDKRSRLIKDYSYLLWHIPEKEKKYINDELLVEIILTNGDWKGFNRLVDLLGIKKVSEIFYNQIGRRRNNYRKRTKHFFSLYFKEHVS